MSQAATGTVTHHAMARRAALGGFVGTAVEWYDFFAFGTAAALVFNTVFFPMLDPVVGTVSALGTFSAGFLARPIGGLLAGHYGDRFGRKGMLVATLVAMSSATFLIGCLPGYASAEVWAPVLLVLLRVFQGLAVGGEWGGAVLIAMEHAPAHRRGLYASFAHASAPVGGLLSTGAFTLALQLPQEQFLAWGWRIPFLLSAIGLVVGLVVRLGLVESPEFEEVRSAGRTAARPATEIVRQHWPTVLLSVGAKLVDGSTSYLMKVFLLSFAVKSYGVPSTTMLNAVMAASLVQLVAIPGFAALSDKVGRYPVCIGGAVLVIILAFPTFWLVETRDALLVALGVTLMLGVAWSAMYGPQAALFSELFDARLRYTGASLGYQISSVIGGGLSPVIAAALVAWAGGSAWPVSVYLIGLAVVSIACLERLRRRVAAASEDVRRVGMAPNAVHGVVPPSAG